MWCPGEQVVEDEEDPWAQFAMIWAAPFLPNLMNTVCVSRVPHTVCNTNAKGRMEASVLILSEKDAASNTTSEEWCERCSW